MVRASCKTQLACKGAGNLETAQQCGHGASTTDLGGSETGVSPSQSGHSVVFSGPGLD